LVFASIDQLVSYSGIEETIGCHFTNQGKKGVGLSEGGLFYLPLFNKYPGEAAPPRLPAI
jgi:hypothetical protein